MSATTAHRPQHVSFQSPAASSSLRQSTLKKNMSITQTYYLAHKARGKLSREAAQPDHDLRLLVGHANLLDSLMLELADAEREQERWFNQSFRGANTTPKKLPQERHVSFAPEDVISEDDEEAIYDSDSSEDDYNEDDDIVMTTVPSLRPEQSFKAPAEIQTSEVAEDHEMHDDDLEEDYAQLELVRTPSHSNSPMPELVDESDSSDDESSMPPSPPNAVLPMPSGKDVAAKQEQQQQESLYGDGYHVPQGIPAAISVY